MSILSKIGWAILLLYPILMTTWIFENTINNLEAGPLTLSLLTQVIIRCCITFCITPYGWIWFAILVYVLYRRNKK